MVNSTYFTYAGVFSGRYGLQIADFNADSVEENEAFSPNLSVLTVPRSLRVYHGGINYESSPTCEFSIISEDIIPPDLRSEILSWLIGRKAFLPLRFHNDDWEDFVYYCVFTSSSTIYVNGQCHGFRVTASFDSPFARGTETTSYSEPPSNSNSYREVTINNKSNIVDGYTYPSIKFSTGSQGHGIIIQNLTDDPAGNRKFIFEQLNSSEVVNVDCETKTIISENGGGNVSNFTSKKWLRLRPGNNTLAISCKGFVTIRCPYYAMIGY